MNVRARIAAVIATCVCVASSAVAQSVPESRVQELVRQAAQVAATQPMQGAQAAPAGLATGPTAELTVDDAVARALERNLDIAVERMTRRHSMPRWPPSTARTSRSSIPRC